MNTARENRDIFLISDEFYLSYDYVSVNDDFLPVLVNSLDVANVDSETEDNGYSESSTYTPKSATMWGEAYNVLTKNSLTKRGFKVKPLLKGYECHVLNSEKSIDRLVIYGEEVSFTEIGEYILTVKESAREDKYKTYKLSSSEAYDLGLIKSNEKIISILDSDEYVISKKVLKKEVNSSKMVLEVFYKIYRNIGYTSNIDSIGEKDERSNQGSN